LAQAQGFSFALRALNLPHRLGPMMAMKLVFVGLCLGARASDCGGQGAESLTCQWELDSTRCVESKCEACGEQLACQRCREDTELIYACCNQHSQSTSAPLMCKSAELAETVKGCLDRMCHDCSGEACQKCREDAETISTCCSGDFHDAAVPDMCQSQDNPCADLHGQEELTCAWGLDVARCMAGVCDGGEALCLEDTTKIMACCDQHRHSVAPPRICTDAVLTEDVRSCVLEKCNECQGEQCELCKKDPQVLSQCCTEHQHGFAPPAICRVEDSRSILP